MKLWSLVEAIDQAFFHRVKVHDGERGLVVMMWSASEAKCLWFNLLLNCGSKMEGTGLSGLRPF